MARLTHYPWWHHMPTKILVNNGSDHGMLPDGTKSLPEPMLTQDYWHQSQWNFKENTQDMLAKRVIWIWTFKNLLHQPGSNELTGPTWGPHGSCRPNVGPMNLPPLRDATKNWNWNLYKKVHVSTLRYEHLCESRQTTHEWVSTFFGSLLRLQHWLVTCGIQLTHSHILTDGQRT